MCLNRHKGVFAPITAFRETASHPNQVGASNGVEAPYMCAYEALKLVFVKNCLICLHNWYGS